MRKQKDTSTSLSASSSLRSGHGSGLKTKKSSSTMPDKSGKLRVTSMERKAILEKLTILEALLKKKDDKPLTFKEACAYLGYAPSYLYKLTYKKLIPHYKPTGKMIFFSKNELNEWVYKSRCQNSEISSQNENEEKSKDPNQIEMGFDEKPKSVKREKEDGETEIVIEFPLKSRRRKEL